MTYRNFAPTCMLFLCLLSCSNQHEILLRSTDLNLKYTKAIEYFEAKKYNKALDLFKDIEMITRGTPRDDTVQYFYGLTNYYLNDFESAEKIFSQFGQVFPRSPFASRAVFMRINCLYENTYRYELDQQPTRLAIAAINEYLYDYPNNDYVQVCQEMLDDLNERLDRKGFESAKLYYSIEDYKAATHALKSVLKANPDNRYREDILYYVVASNYKFADLSIPALRKERFLTVIDEYYNFISEFPDSKYRRSVDQMFRRAQHVTKTGKSDYMPLEPESDTKKKDLK